ncbi:hypothetical protein ACIBEJ_20205 [Nonomuraea sp. NPDC050790]|uniref:hypothetical protein n=1 Tax=Nonomuraea sp. NPDC050790 TaxID=3364371 RepID=UPI0037A84FFC
MSLSPDLDERLRAAAARLHRADHVRRLRETTARQIEDVRGALENLESELVEEERDVARLEGGLSAAFARLLGNREERLARERAEAAVARERVDGHRARLAQLQADAAAAEEELQGLGQASQEYAALLAEKERELIRTGDPLARELADLAVELDGLGAAVYELEEVERAGQAAQEALGVVLRLLKSAGNASTWDMFGGGLLVDAYEHDKLTSADKAAWHAQRALDVFARELADTGIAARPKMPEVDTEWFVDAFFDNIITDALKHQRIEKTRAEVERLATWARETVAHLSARRDQLRSERTQMLAYREERLRPA